jgi:hypothetical protein
MTAPDITKRFEAKINRCLPTLARGATLRQIERTFHIDRTAMTTIFRCKTPSIIISNKAAKDVLTKKYKLMDIVKKYGKQGMYSLILRGALLKKDGEKNLSEKVGKLRDKENLCFADIGDRLGIGRSSARTFYGIYSGRQSYFGNKHLDKARDTHAKILKEYNAGVPLEDIAIKYATNILNVRRILREYYNIHFRSKPFSKEELKKVHQLRNVMKLSWKDIGFIFGVSENVAQYHYGEYIRLGGSK